MAVLTSTGAFRAWWSVAMIVLTVLLVAGAGVAYTNHVQRQADRRHAAQEQREKQAQELARRRSLAVVCAWLEVRIDPDPPPSTPRGREQLRADQRLYEQFRCQESD